MTQTRTQERIQTIKDLLAIIHIAQVVDGNPDGGRGQGNDSRILTFSPGYNRTLRELDRQLEHMRNPAGERHAGHSLATLRRHVIRRYVDTDDRYPKRKPAEARTRNGHIEIQWDGQWQPARTTNREPLGEPYNGPNNTRYVLLSRWSPDTNPQLAQHGLDWLEQHMPGRLDIPGTEREAA